jgi:ABC-type Fe3+-hydroxamate transport system substrate-binding protein
VRARNVAEGLPAATGSHAFVDKETLLRLNPDIIFIDGGGLVLVQDDYAKKTAYYKTLKAFSGRKVFESEIKRVHMLPRIMLIALSPAKSCRSNYRFSS